ncbi:hypothetical protein DRQ09_03035 [candidate division KSB1 bacterium]|nr:MAG: hypothetical protein DRQ09_03035 [candidate division KSB1 bacterium]
MRQFFFRKRNIVIISVVMIFIIIIIITSNKKVNREVIPVGVSRRGDLVINLVESGDVFATRSRIICAPTRTKSTLQIIYLIPEGTIVNKGDTLIRFDTKQIESRIETYEKSLQQHREDLKKVIAQHESKMDELYSDLKVMENTYKLAELYLYSLKYESDAKKKEGELQFKNAKLNLEEQKEKIKNQKIINSVELSNAQLKVKDDSVKLEYWKEKLKELTVCAPIEGLVVYHEYWDWSSRTFKKVEDGNVVYEGMPIIDLPDTYEMKVRLMVNEVDVGRLKVGQKAKVILDAYPEIEFNGTINSISAIVEDLETNVRRFNVEVVVDEKNSPYFRPGMTARVEIALKKLKDVVYVPVGAVYEIDDKPVVFVKEGSFRPRFVKIGEKGLNYIEIKENLKEGEVIALKDPTGTAQMLGTAEKKRIELAQRQAIIEKFMNLRSSEAYSDEKTDRVNKPKEIATPEEMLEKYAQRLLQNPKIKAEYDKRVKEDPELKTSIEKRMRFFQEMAMKYLGTKEGTFGSRRRQFNINNMTPQQRAVFEKRLLQNPEIKKEYEKRLKKDPSLATDNNKRNKFFREMMVKLRNQRQRNNR